MPKREFVGIVLSAGKADKTIKVKVETLAMHPKYKKYIKRSKNYLVHDPENRAKIGDKVLIREGRPFSKLKRFYLVDVLSKKGGDFYDSAGDKG